MYIFIDSIHNSFYFLKNRLQKMYFTIDELKLTIIIL